MSDKDLKATGRGSFDYRIDLHSSLRVVKWYDDNKGVILGSFSPVKASSTKKRWDSKKKEHCNVAYHDTVKEYNESMGGVDLNDMPTSLYRVDKQTMKRWYLKINIQHSMLQFMKGVADALLFVGKEPVRKTPGRPKM